MQRPGNIRQRFESTSASDVSSSMYPFELGNSSNQPEQIEPGTPSEQEPLVGTGPVEEGDNDFEDTDMGDNFVNFDEEIIQETTTFEQAEEGNNDFADTDLGDDFVNFDEEIKQETTFSGQAEEGNNDLAGTDLGDNVVNLDEEIKPETTTFGQPPVQNIAALDATPEQPKMSRKALKKIRYNQFKLYKSLGLEPPMKVAKKGPTGLSDTIRDVPAKTVRGAIGGNLGRTQYKSAFKRMRTYLGKEGITHLSENKAYCELCQREFDPNKQDGSNSDLHIGDFIHLMNLLKVKFPEEAKKHEVGYNEAIEPNCDQTKMVQFKRQLLMAVQEATKEIRQEMGIQESAKANEEGAAEGASGVNKPASTGGVRKTGTPAKPDGQTGKTTTNTLAKPGQGKPNQVRPQGNPSQNQPRQNLKRPGVRITGPRPNLNAVIRGQQPFLMPQQLPGWPHFPRPQNLRMNIRSPFSSSALGIAALNHRNLLIAQRLGLRPQLPLQPRLQANETFPAGPNSMDIGGNLPAGSVINRLRDMASSGPRKRLREDNERRQEGPQQFYDVEQPYDEWHNPDHLNQSNHESHRGGPGPNAPPPLMSLNAGKGPDVAAKRNALLMTLNQLGDSMITNKEEADIATKISFSLNKALNAYYQRQGGNRP